MSFADWGPIWAKRLDIRVPCLGTGSCEMAPEREVESRFTGMIFLLRRVIPGPPDGHSRLSPMPDMGFARERPRRK